MALGVVGLASVYGSWRTQRFGSGFVAALGAFVVVWVFMMLWWNITFYPFAQVQQSNPYWVQAWQWSTHRPNQSPNETFLHWIFWDNVGALIIFSFVGLTVSAICGGLGGLVGLKSAHSRPASHES